MLIRLEAFLSGSFFFFALYANLCTNHNGPFLNNSFRTYLKVLLFFLKIVNSSAGNNSRDLTLTL